MDPVLRQATKPSLSKVTFGLREKRVDGEWSESGGVAISACQSLGLSMLPKPSERFSGHLLTSLELSM